MNLCTLIKQGIFLLAHCKTKEILFLTVNNFLLNGQPDKNLRSTRQRLTYY